MDSEILYFSKADTQNKELSGDLRPEADTRQRSDNMLSGQKPFN